MKSILSALKYGAIFAVYLWLRIDLILRLAFGRNWTPRYEFMVTIFGEKDTEKFLNKRKIKYTKAQEKKNIPYIFPSKIDQEVSIFLKSQTNTKQGRQQRLEIINQLIFWALDPDINQHNIESYKTRQTIADSLLGAIFQNCLADEIELILSGLNHMVFSRVTYLGSKGEPSPIVHNAIIHGAGKILDSHFDEITQIRTGKLEELTRIKLIKEIKSDQQNRGSLAFSGTNKKNDLYRNKFPLSATTAKMLLEILQHYQYSAWPESRESTKKMLDTMARRLGFNLEESVERSLKKETQTLNKLSTQLDKSSTKP